MDDGGVLGIIAQSIDEQAVDLQRVDRVVLERCQRREAGAEVVHRDPHPELAQHVQGCGGRVQIVDHAGLGDLQGQPARVQPSSSQRLGDPLGQVALAKLPAGQVHTHPERWVAMVAWLPGGQLLAGVVERPQAEGDDQARSARPVG